MQSQRALVLAPHTDDAELGCGGTISKLVEQGTEVSVIAFSTAEESLPDGMDSDTLRKEFWAAMPVLGVSCDFLHVCQFPVRRLNEHRQEVLEELVRLRSELDPDLVLLPSMHDMHQDHQVVHAEGLRAFKNVTVLGYELPWNNITFDAQAFVALEDSHVKKKIKALQCYDSQLSLNRPYFKKDFLEGWAKMRGLQVKVDWAEAFEVMRIKW